MSCQASEFSIQLLGVKPVYQNECGPNLTDETFMDRGTVDIILADSYKIHVSMQNRLLDSLAVNNLKITDGRVNTTDITLTSASIEYLDPDELGFGFSEDREDIPFSGILPNSSTTKLIQGIDVLNPEQILLLREHGAFKGVNAKGNPAPVRSTISMIVRIQVHGNTLDGKKVSSNLLSFPIDICTGCRVSLQSNEDGCEMVSEDELSTFSECPVIVGKDNHFASCALCKQMTTDEFMSLCD